MIDIYAINTRGNSGTIKIQSVPAINQNDVYILSPTVKVDMGNAESMDFSVQAGTPYYDSFIQMRTFIRVDYDGTTIFYGRVLTIDNGAFGSRKIHCEGAISLLNDTQFPARSEKEKYEQTIYEHISDIIANHNRQVNDGLKHFELGEVPGHYSSASSVQRIANESREFGSTSWSDSKAMLEDLKSHYGGHFRARYSGGTIYLDWMNHYFRSTVNSQTIEVGKNLLDISGSTEVSNIFTAIIPIGKKKDTKENEDDKVYIDYNGRNYMTIPEVRNFYTDDQLDSGYHQAADYRDAIANYGMIFKTVDIQEGSTPDELKRKAAQWIKENYQGGIESFSVKAIDFRQIGESTDAIYCGDRVKIRYVIGSTDTAGRITEKTLTCTSVTYDLFNPENNQYSFGIPANALSRNYGVTSTRVNNSTKTSSKSTKSKSTASTSLPNYGGSEKPTDPNEQWRKAVYAELKKHKPWYRSTGNVETCPPDPSRDNMPNLQKIWHAHSTMTDGKSNFEVWLPRAPHYITGQSVYATRVRGWDRDTQGRPLGNWIVGTEEQLTISYLRSHYLFEYMVDEHGVDLTTDLAVKMPGNYTDEEGNLELNGYTPVVDPETGEITRYTMAQFGKFDADTGIMEYFGGIEFGNFDPESGVFNFLKSDGNGFISRQVDGDWHYYIIDPDDPTKLVEVTSTRDLHIRELRDDRRIGWVVEEDPTDPDNPEKYLYKNPGNMMLQIEKTAKGNMVFAYFSGEATYLGNKNTEYYAATSVEHMDQICGDFEYEKDEYGIPRVKLKSAGGMRIWHGKKKADGTYETDDQGRIVYSEFGVYDDNTLTGGIVVDKLNDGTTTTTIKGSRIRIGDKDTDNVTITDALEIVSYNGVQSVRVKKQLVTYSDVFVYGGNLSVAAGGSNSKGQITGTTLHVGVGGSLIFNDRNNTSTPAIDRKAALGLVDTYSHVCITGPENNEYKLYYLPATVARSGDPGAQSDWIESGTFSRAITSWDILWDDDGNVSVKARPQNQTSPKIVTTLQYTDYRQNPATDPLSAYAYVDWGNTDLTDHRFITRKRKIVYLVEKDKNTTNAAVYACLNAEGDGEYGKVSVSHQSPYGTAINASQNAASVTTTADGKTATLKLFRETIGFPGTSATQRSVTAQLGGRNIARISVEQDYSDGKSAGVSEGESNIRNKIHGLGTVSFNTTYSASSYGWEGFSSFTVPAASSYPYTITFSDKGFTTETLPGGTKVYHWHYDITTNSASAPAGGQMTFHYN